MCGSGYLCQNGIIAEKSDYFTEHKNCLTHFFCFPFSINQSFTKLKSWPRNKTNIKSALISPPPNQSSSDEMVCGRIIKLWIVLFASLVRDCWSETFAPEHTKRITKSKLQFGISEWELSAEALTLYRNPLMLHPHQRLHFFCLLTLQSEWISIFIHPRMLSQYLFNPFLVYSTRVNFSKSF